MMTTKEVKEAMEAAQVSRELREKSVRKAYHDEVEEIQSQCPHENVRYMDFMDRDYIIGDARICNACLKELHGANNH